MATEQTQKLVTITSKAAEKIQEFMAEEEGKTTVPSNLCPRWWLFWSIIRNGL